MLDIDKKVSYGEFFANLKTVFSWLEDDISRNLFLMQMNAAVVREKTTINHLQPYLCDKIRNDLDKYNNSIHDIDFDKDEIIIIYGAGIGGQNIIRNGMLNLRKRVKEVIFCDRNAENICIPWAENISIITPDELFENYNNCRIIVGSFMFYDEIYNILIENNIPRENIIFHVLMDSKNQYFDEVIQFQKDEVFVDAGVFDGDTSLIFESKCPDYKHIYMFEPDEKQYDDINSVIDTKFKSATIYNKGLWNKKETLNFNRDGSKSQITPKGNDTIEVDTLDALLQTEKVTFIKMDIEGSELNALKGARETIKRNKPKLAICIYHKPEDIVEILGYIKFLVPEYKFYIRHYTNAYFETVLYAVL